MPVVPVLQWIKLHKNDFILMKIDIEGGEFGVFKELATTRWLGVLNGMADGSQVIGRSPLQGSLLYSRGDVTWDICGV